VARGRTADRATSKEASMIFRPFYTFETGCAAYLFGCGGKGLCCVVDPQEKDVDAYAAFAADKGRRITHVFETHIHADHRSGGRALAELAGARYCLHRSATVAFPFEPVDDGQVIELGNTIVRVLHTPGHTPESICLVVSDLRRGPEPWFVCTGDTLFVGAVGRPDLPGDERENAAALYHSLRDKLLALPDDLEVYPAHFAGSACGVGMSGKPMSTLGFERQWNPLLALPKLAFVDTVGGTVPPKPPNMESVLRANQGRAA
jgi:glyoxylase-like metal-dependent hydrolase (beta-lactamase superfamily II)